MIGLDWAVPGFSTLSRRQRTLKVNIPCRGSVGSLYLPVDSTGIKVEGEWNARKHGGSKRRVRRKLHIGIDEQTLEIRAAAFTTSDVGDAPVLPELPSGHIIRAPLDLTSAEPIGVASWVGEDSRAC